MADTPVSNPSSLPNSPDARAVPPASPAVRAGTPPADTPAQAAIRANRVAATTPAGAEPTGMTTDQVMPTCMIVVTLGGVGLLALIMFGWMFGEISTFLQRLFQG